MSEITPGPYTVRLPEKGWTKDERDLYDNQLVRVLDPVQCDGKGAVSVVFRSGPCEGAGAWFQPDVLERNVPMPISTAGDW